MAFRCAQKKKDLGTQGSHSPAIKHVTAHGNPTNRMLQNLGSDSALRVEPLLVKETTGGAGLIASEAPKT